MTSPRVASPSLSPKWPSGVVIGVSVNLATAPGADSLNGLTTAFSESLGRLLVEVHPDDAVAFERLMGGYPTAPIGETNTSSNINITASDFDIGVAVTAASGAWRGGVV